MADRRLRMRARLVAHHDVVDCLAAVRRQLEPLAMLPVVLEMLMEFSFELRRAWPFGQNDTLIWTACLDCAKAGVEVHGNSQLHPWRSLRVDHVDKRLLYGRIHRRQILR